MRHDAEGRIIEVGARTRTIPPALRRALHHRDKGCRFPGCGRPFGEGRHIKHWAHGGPTTLSNLAMLCRRHHRAVHEDGFQIERLADGELCFRRSDGRPIPNVPATLYRAGEPERNATSSERQRRRADQCAHVDARLAGRAPRCRICDQRAASAGHRQLTVTAGHRAAAMATVLWPRTRPRHLRHRRLNTQRADHAASQPNNPDPPASRCVARHPARRSHAARSSSPCGHATAREHPPRRSPQ